MTPAPDDAPPAARLREAGTVLLAKTTMPDYGMLCSGLSSFHPLTRNPWDLSCNPGGSSAGAAAAAAAGYGPLHMGTDIGGSIRLPACWCGVFGLKPSLGRVPIHPPYSGRAAGPMTRSVADAALLMRALALPDARDSMSLPPHDIDWGDLERDLRGLRIGLLLDAGWGLPVDAEVREAVEAAARAVRSGRAPIVDPMKAFTTRVDGRRHVPVLAHALLARHRGAAATSAARACCRSSSSGRAAQQARTARRCFARNQQMHAIREATVAACEPYDFVLSPVSPIAGFAAELRMRRPMIPITRSSTSHSRCRTT